MRLLILRCWLLVMCGSTNGGYFQQFDVAETKIFSASLDCLTSYQSNESIICKFLLTNNDHRDHSVLKLHTPLEGQPSDCLRVTRNGKKIEYDGIFVKRSLPGPEDFLLVQSGKTVSASYDVSAGYDMSEGGTYTIAVDTYIEYLKGSIKGMNIPGNPAIPTKVGHLSSKAVVFKVKENQSRKTRGETVRFIEKNKLSRLSAGKVENIGKRSQVVSPRDPVFIGGSADQRAEAKEVHRAAYHYLGSAISDLRKSSERVTKWFGRLSYKVVKTYEAMKRSLENDEITYDLTTSHSCCSRGAYACTYKYSKKIYLCRHYLKSQIMSGFDNKVGVFVHELAHARAGIADIIYGRVACKGLAKSNPDRASNNADSYEYFIETLYPFNHGVDAATTLPDGFTYLFKGNFFVKFKDGVTGFSPRFPVLLKERFMNLPGNFVQGFDSFVCHKAFHRSFASKGNAYIRFNTPKAETLSNGYPKTFSAGWGVRASSFDSWVQLPNGVTYMTKNHYYVRYSNLKSATLDQGYPKTFDSEEWGSLPESFKSGFDAMTVLPNGKLYVFRGSQYIRYNHFPWKSHDSGYPLPIKGHWGDVSQD